MLTHQLQSDIILYKPHLDKPVKKNKGGIIAVTSDASSSSDTGENTVIVYGKPHVV